MPALPTVPVRISVYDQSGSPVSGGRVTARLDRTDYMDGYVIAPETLEGETNDAGLCILNLWPNELGTSGSLYKVVAYNPDDQNRRYLNVLVAVPNAACQLEHILQQQPFPPIDAAQAALQAAQSALADVTEQAQIATAQAGQAAASAEAAASERVQTGLDAQATAADRIQAALDRQAAASSAIYAAQSASNAAGQVGLAAQQVALAQSQANLAAGSAQAAAIRADAAASSASNAAGQVALAAQQVALAQAQADLAGEHAQATGADRIQTSLDAQSADASATLAGISATEASGQVVLAAQQVALAQDQADLAAAAAQAAGGSAGTATTQAGIATAKAGESFSSASAAAGYAGTAATQAGIATTKAAEAAANATAAANSYDAFDDRYLGAKSTAPAVDNDGQALLVGALYWDTGLSAMRVWSGSSWVDVNELDGRVLSDQQLLGAAVYATDMALQAVREITRAEPALQSQVTGLASNVAGYDLLLEQLTYAATHLAGLAGVTARAISGGAVALQGGTAATPSLTSSTDITAGVFFPAAGVVALATAALERLRVTADGRFGIGTTTPSGLLDVADNKIRVRTAQTPASATASGNQGDIAWDAGYVYVCTATNTWKRAALASW